MSTLVEECLDGLSSTVMLNWDYKDPKCREYLDQLISDDSLSEFADCLSVDSGELETHVKPCLREILNSLVSHSGCPIDRFCVSGSIGHQQEGSSDKLGFDITVFVDCEASHHAGHENLDKCSVQSSERIYSSIRKIVPHPLSEDHRGLHFVFQGFQFHLAVTPSLGHKMHLQRKHVWDLIEARDKQHVLSQVELDRFSVALHESLTSFMHMGDPVFHGLVRLARLWRDNMCPTLLSAFAVTLVMMRCIEDEKARGMTSPRSASPSRQQTVFPVQQVLVAFLTNLTEIDSLRMSWQRFYEPDLIPERHIAISGPRLIDPVNPWRNLLATLDREHAERVKQTALKALEQLKQPDRCTVFAVFMGPTAAAKGG